MLVSSSEGFARDGLLAAILLRALMIAVVVGKIEVSKVQNYLEVCADVKRVWFQKRS